MTHEKIDFEVGGAAFELHAEWDEARAGRRPAVLICHAWAGQTENERSWARDLAALGYVGVAHDVYGKGVVGGSAKENQALMGPLMHDRDRLLQRLEGGLAAARRHPQVDPARVAAIGFCFGGLCVLDMARGGLDLRGVVSFHGLFHPRPIAASGVKAKVLVCHGYDDPMAKPEAMVGFANEMTHAGVDFQLIAYGQTKHAFTNPAANDDKAGTVYQPRTAARSKRAMQDFLAEVLA